MAMREVDTIADKYYARIYSDPLYADSGLTALSASLSDSDQYHSIYAMIALVKLVEGNAQASDSIISDVRRFVANNDARYARERLAITEAVINSLYGRNEASCDDFIIAYNFAVENKDWMNAIKNMANVGELTELLGDPAEAVIWLRNTLVLADSVGISDMDFSVRTRLAGTYTSMQNFAEADRLFERNASLVSAESPSNQFFYYSARGNSLYYRQLYAQALQDFKLAAATLAHLGDPYMEAVTMTNIGEVYMYLGQLDSAQYYVDRAVKTFDEIAVNDPGQLFYLNSLRGDLEMRLGNLAEARRLLMAIDPDSVNITPRYIAVHHRRLQDFYQAVGDYKNSLNHLIKADVIDDSLQTLIARNFSEEVDNRYSRDTTVLHARLRVSQKEEEISMLYLWIIGAVLVAIVVIFALIINQVIRRRRAARQLDEMRDSLIGIRMESTRNRISPHFIFNLLNNELPDDNVNVRNLVNLMRLNLDLCNQPVITMTEELNFIKLYVKVVKDSIGPRLKFDVNISSDIDTDKVKIPSMMLQIFAENAVKHGLRGYEDSGKKLTIDIRRAGGGIEVSIANTTLPGHYKATNGTGTGLRVVSQTIATLNTHNQQPIEMSQQVEQLTDGHELYIVRVFFPDGYDYTMLEH